MNIKMNTETDLCKDKDDEMSPLALKAFFNIALLWKLNTEQERLLLGNPSQPNYSNWKLGVIPTQLNQDTLERISYILGIYKALQILLPNPSSADEWIKKKNTAPFFSGKAALDLLLTGNMSDLVLVRKYLDGILQQT
jgi:hypothetical protein